MKKEKLTWTEIGKLSLGVCPECGGSIVEGPKGSLVLRYLDCSASYRKPLSKREVIEE